MARRTVTTPPPVRKVYIVSYDLIAASPEEYKDLYQKLRRLGGSPILDSQWAIRDSRSAEGVLDHLLLSMDTDDDRLLVTALDGDDWASYNLKTRLNDF